MLGTQYYHGLTRKYTALFGTLFNNIYISRFNTDDSLYETMKVPISFGSIEKYLEAVETFDDTERKVSIILPRISFDIIDIVYDSRRKFNRNDVILSQDIQNKMYTPVPYNIIFSLTIAANRTEDGYQILEQILPFFNPEFSVTAKLIDEFPNLTLDLPINLNSINPDMNYQGPTQQRRILRWNLQFTMNAFYFGPVSTASVIKIAKVNFITNWETNKVAERLSVYPGLTANGEPTTDPNNAISYLDVEPTDNYDYIVTIETNPEE